MSMRSLNRRILIAILAASAQVFSACATTTTSVASLSIRSTPPSTPTPDQIEAEADRADVYLSDRVLAGAAERRSLRSSARVGTWIARLGQFVGGGGAVIFGLDDDGRNAAWSAVVGAVFSFVDDIWNVSGKERDAENCGGLAALELDVKKHTAVWRLNKDNDAFRATFANADGPFVAFYDLVDTAYDRCFR
jgi:hypothetical protein